MRPQISKQCIDWFQANSIRLALVKAVTNYLLNDFQPSNSISLRTDAAVKCSGIEAQLEQYFQWLFDLMIRFIFRVPINLAILSLIESGELTELFNKWWFENAECDVSEKQETSRNELSLRNVAGIFFILIGGLILSLIVALFEFLLNKRNEKFVQHPGHALHHNHQHHHQQASQASQQMQTHPSHMQHNSEALKTKLTMQPGCEYDNNGTTVSYRL